LSWLSLQSNNIWQQKFPLLSSSNNMHYGNPMSAISYLCEGASILCTRDLRKFVIIPLLINLIVFGAITTFLINTYGGIFDDAASSSSWQAAIAWVLLIITG